jgi:hypothetical protein
MCTTRKSAPSELGAELDMTTISTSSAAMCKLVAALNVTTISSTSSVAIHKLVAAVNVSTTTISTSANWSRRST